MQLQLAKLLVKQDLVSINQIRSAIELQRKEGIDLGESLVNLGYVSEEQLVDFLSREYGVPVENIDDLSIETYIIDLIPKDTAIDNCLIPISISGSALIVAMADPSNILLIDDLSFVTGNTIKPVISSERSIKNKLSEYYVDMNSDIETGSDIDSSPDGDFSLLEMEEATHIQTKKRNDEDRSIDEIVRELEEFKFGAKVNEVAQSEESLSVPDISFERDLSVGVEDISDISVSSDEVAEDEETLEIGLNIGNVESIEEPSQAIDPVFSLINADVEIGTDNTTDRSPEISFASEEEEAEQQSELSDFIDVSIKEDVSNKEIVDEVSDHNIGFQSPVQTPESEELKTEPENSTQNQFSLLTNKIDYRSEENTVIDESANNEADHNDSQYVLDSAVQPQEPVYPSVDDNNIDNLQDQHSEAQHDFALVSSLAEVSVEVESADEPDNDELLLEDVVLDQEVESDYIGTEEFADPEMIIEEVPEQAPLELLSPVELVIDDEDVSNIQIPEPKEVVEEGPMSVLVIDDSPTVQKIVTITLEREGYEVFVAGDGMEALSKLHEIKPNLIFLDINLPHMDGYQLCKIIKNHGLTKDVPVVMLSGKDGFFDKMKGRMAGAKDYIKKPFEPDVIIEAEDKYSKL